MGGNYALSINMFEDPNTKNPGKRGCVRNNVDTVNMEKKEDFGVRSDSDEHEGTSKDASGKCGESTKKVVDEILGFDAGLWNELSDLSNLHRH
ncbi:hypothetical protein NEUTE1DRAFT_98737 [Neurospora tetrasperma FGSC 2508]|uniref:Uncharacterized protein n=1 Tax=Neurospora tetrasperma (strain FGSC 2508 / ATCC MYA-4615 / P0657) TaxID=510951 RepID=F8MEM8_NEUT8|nr:uncharacterized protein NEUTE1DRAFT_98737 [Neurospora tetrasperma FGSC 2508]EGO61657.1 hypothetical protein NEUTE1DRAFT_98737 [Neurospora tetrasperma FGSC 2508]EGZ74294.1 hypothetical protein NEUTE2DRAFT_125270 [Neurospora tetrasperma FGSC 2509]